MESRYDGDEKFRERYTLAIVVTLLAVAAGVALMSGSSVVSAVIVEMLPK